MELFKSRGQGFLVITLSLVIIGFSVNLFLSVPSEENIKSCMSTQMYNVRLCEKDKNYVRLNQISPYLKSALIISEDGYFYSHKGFDWDSLKINLEEGLKAGVFKRGGSTITQQLAKNMYLSSDRTWLRKLKEALITMKLEKVLTKNQILEKYLNIIEFGSNLYGIRAASQYYFSKQPLNLTPLESAFLVMLLPNPKKYSISYRKKQLTPYAKQKIRQILDRMKILGKIDNYQYLVSKINLTGFPWQNPIAITREEEDAISLEAPTPNETIIEDENILDDESIDEEASDYL